MRKVKTTKYSEKKEDCKRSKKIRQKKEKNLKKQERRKTVNTTKRSAEQK